jgi:serine/threonine protein kinase/tetratricopeptide (TPR) repeat protein
LGETLESLTWFGQYRLTSRLATGGMAEVYIGRHISPDGKFGPMVAVKRLMPHLLSDNMVVRMFLNEARITAQINHPNVVRIIDLGPKAGESGEPYIAMELLEGHSFAEVRQKAAQNAKRVPLGITLRALAEACRGLDAAHRAVDEEGRFLCIVHRDFTPDNIHVGVLGDVKVIDFGIAKAQNWGAGTEPGMLKGKFFYMSPEMIAGKSVDHRADLFAAGVMLYEQLCGRRPFTGLTTEEVVTRISEGRPKRPTEFDPSVPPALEAICLMALHKDPESRFPSLQEFIAAIESVGGSAQVASKDEMAAYMSQLFPTEKDVTRQTLKKARQADPSLPAARSADEALKSADAVLDERLMSITSQPGVPRPVAAPAQPEPAPAVAPPAAPALPKKRSLAVPATIAAALLLAAGAGAWWVTRPPALTPAERLSLAEKDAVLASRADALLPLAKDKRATADDLVKAGELLLAVGAAEPALTLADAAEGRFPKDARAWLFDARASMRLRKGKRAETALDKATLLAPNDVAPDLLYADLRQMQGDLSGALDALGRANAKQPGSVDLAARRGYLLSQAGKLDEAAEVLQGVLAKQHDAASAAELAFVRFRQDQTDEALSLLKKALKKQPQLAVAHYYLGAVLFRQGDAKSAERAYREADRIDPADPRPLTALCQMQALSSAPGLDETRKALSQRFPADAAALLAQCSR